jgi:hypothetical protein
MPTWERGTIDTDAIVAGGQPGDRILRRGDDTEWRLLRHRLTLRGLAVAALGRRLYIVPQEVLPRWPLLQQVAAAAKDNPSARAALQDLIEELFPPMSLRAKSTLARCFTDACAELPGKHVVVPGGVLDKQLLTARQAAPTPISKSLTRKTAKLSKLQRSLLTLARDYRTQRVPGRYIFNGAAPLNLMRADTRAGAAALSRALRRLEGRGLVQVHRTESGRATHISLTADGRRATAEC